MNPRLKALADALDRLRASIDGSFGDESDAGQALREASALIRSLSDVEPIGYLVKTCKGYNRGIHIGTEAAVRARHALDPDILEPVYTHPAPETEGHPTEHSGSVPQAPAEGVERDAARYRQIRSTADWDNEGGHGGWTISVRDRSGLRLSDLDAAIDAQIKTGEAPK